MGKKTTCAARFLFYTEVQPVLLLFSRPHELKSEAPPKETTGKRPCEAGRCKGICQGLSSVTAYFYFFIATFALRQWAVQILHRRVPTALRPMARRPVVETTLQPSGRTSAGGISVRNINKKTGRALKRKTRWNGTNFYQTDASVRNTLPNLQPSGAQNFSATTIA